MSVCMKSPPARPHPPVASAINKAGIPIITPTKPNPTTQAIITTIFTTQCQFTVKRLKQTVLLTVTAEAESCCVQVLEWVVFDRWSFRIKMWLPSGVSAAQSGYASQGFASLPSSFHQDLIRRRDCGCDLPNRAAACRGRTGEGATERDVRGGAHRSGWTRPVG